MRKLCCVALFLSSLLLCQAALAQHSALYEQPEPEKSEKPAPVQWNASFLAGYIGVVRGEEVESSLWLSFRPEILFGQREPEQVCGGPYFELGGSTGSHGLVMGAGATMLVPVVMGPGYSDRADFALAPSLGVYTRRLDQGVIDPGVTASLFLGSSGHNKDHGMQWLVGARLEGRFDLGPEPDYTFIASVQIDLSAALAVAAMAAFAANVGH